MSDEYYYDDDVYDSGYGDYGNGGCEADDYATQDTSAGDPYSEASYNDVHTTGADNSDQYTADSDTATQHTPTESSTDEHCAAQDEPSSQWSGGYNEPYTVTSSGENSQVRNTSFPSDSSHNRLT